MRPACMADLLEVEDGARRKCLPGESGEGDKFDVGVAKCAADRAVGGAEVNSDGGDLLLRLLHSLYYFALCVPLPKQSIRCNH